MGHNLAIKLEDIPLSLRSKKIGDLTTLDRRFISDLFLVKEWIRISYKEQARIMQKTIDKKREAGFCGGFIYCLSYTGEKFMCDKCKDQKANPQRRYNISQYGRIRRQEKMMK